MHDLLVKTVIGLITLTAMARATRLVTGDTITQPLRDWFDHHATPREGATRPAPWIWRKAALIVNCHWCASIYVGLAGTNAYLSWAYGLMTPTWQPVYYASIGILASSWLIATAADWLDSPAPEKQHAVRITDER